MNLNSWYLIIKSKWYYFGICEIKLSEDFPNFIRVDLYLFKQNIYLSELTFDSHSRRPAFKDIKFFNDGLKNWKRIDYWNIWIIIQIV